MAVNQEKSYLRTQCVYVLAMSMKPIIFLK